MDIHTYENRIVGWIYCDLMRHREHKFNTHHLSFSQSKINMRIYIVVLPHLLLCGLYTIQHTIWHTVYACYMLVVHI